MNAGGPCLNRSRRHLGLAVWVLAWALGLLGAAGAAWAAPEALRLSSERGELALAGRSEWLLDRGGGLDVEAVERASGWQTREAGHAVTLERGDALWVRFVAYKPHDGPDWMLDVDLPGVDRATLFYRDGENAWVLRQGGDSLPQSAWNTAGRKPHLRLSRAIEREVPYFVRIEHARVPFTAGLFLKTQQQVAETEQRAMFLLGIYFGLALLAISVAGATAVVYRDRAFGMYAGYVSAMALAQAGMTGAGSLVIWPEWPWLSNPITFFMPVFAGALGLAFVRIVASPKRHSRLLDRLAVGLVLALLAVAAFDLLHPTTAGFELSMRLLTLSMAVVMVLLLLAVARGDPHSRWFALGFAPILVGGALPLARNFGLLPSGFLSEYGLLLGSAVEMPLLFYGLNRRLAEQSEARVRARDLAATDPLTGLATRKRLLDALRAEMDQTRNEVPFALLLVELANLRLLMHEHGAPIRERALVLAAAHLRSAAREGHVVARVDDHVFAILAQRPKGPTDASALATQIVAQGLRPSPLVPGHEVLRFHVAVGVLPWRDMDAEGVLRILTQELAQIGPDARKTIRTVRADGL